MASAKKAEVHPTLHTAVLDIVKSSHHDDIELVLDSIYGRLKSRLGVGELADFKADGKTVKCEVVEVSTKRLSPVKISLLSDQHQSSPSSDKENDFAMFHADEVHDTKYSVMFNGKVVSAIPYSALKRCYELPPRAVLKDFIKSRTKMMPDASGFCKWTVTENSKKRKASMSPKTPAKKTKPDGKKSKTPIQKNTLDAFISLKKLPGKSPNSETNSGIPNKKTPVKEGDKSASKTPTIDLTQSPSLSKNKKTHVADGNSAKNTSAERTTPNKRSKSSVRLNSDTPTTKGSGKKKTPVKKEQKRPSAKRTYEIAKVKQTKNIAAGKKKADPNSGQVVMLSPVVVNGENKDDKHNSLDLDDGMDSGYKPTISLVTCQRNGQKDATVLMSEIKDKQGNITTKINLVNSASQSVNITSPKKGEGHMRQMTLFDLAKYKSPPSEKDKFAEFVPPTPKVVRQFKKAVKEENDRMKNKCVLTAAKEMNADQRAQLPSPMKQLVNAKVEFLEARAKLKHMTDEEKQNYIKEKAKLARQAIQSSQKTIDEDTKFTDSLPLPPPDLVTLPDAMPAGSVNDLMCVSQFLICFNNYLLKPEKTSFTDLTFTTLAQVLGESDVRSKAILMSLLDTLLNDFTFNEAYEMGVLLKDISINKNTISNLLYVTLVLTSEKAERSTIEKEQLTQLADKIKDREIEELSPTERLDCMVSLCNLLLDCQGIIDFQGEAKHAVSKACKAKSEFMKEYVETKREHRSILNPIVDGAEDASADNTGRSTPTSSVEGDANISQPQSLTEVLKLRRELSKKSAEERERKQKEEKKQKQIEAESEALERKKLNLEDKIQELQQIWECTFRLEPLGTDRHHSRYWYLPGHTGLYVEKGWFGEYYHYQVQTEYPDSCSKLDSFLYNNVSTEIVPQMCSQSWHHYKDKAAVDALMSALNKRGIRECLLHIKLKNNYTRVTAAPKESVSDSTIDKADAEKKTSLETLKEEVLDFEDRLRSAGLGGIDEYTEWSEELSLCSDLSSVAECLLQTQSSVHENRRCGVLASKKLPKSAETEEQKKPNDSEESAVEPANKYLLRWQQSVRQATTASRLHVLLDILDSCVMWDKSIDNVKCRLCRRMGDDASMLLCDGCDLGFHLGCLRLKKVPEGDWFCPSCKPPEQRKARNNRNLKDLSDSESSADSEEDSEEEEESDEEVESCVTCDKQGGDIALCDTCLSGYHVTCHDPPLRAVPRFAWTCHECRFGTKKGKGNQAKKQEKSAPSTQKTLKNVNKRLQVNLKRCDSEEPQNGRKRKRDSQETKGTKQKGSPPTRRTNRNREPSPTEDATQEERPRKSARNSALQKNEETTPTAKTACVTASRSTYQLEESSESDSEVELTMSLEQKEIANILSPKKLRRTRSATTIKTSTSKPTVKEEPSPALLELRKVLKTVFNKLWNHSSAWPFESHVSESAVPDYYEVIETPICLSDVEKKLVKYETAEEFVDDISLMMYNSYLYNKKETEIAKLTLNFEEFFIKQLARFLPDCHYQKQNKAFGVTSKR